MESRINSEFKIVKLLGSGGFGAVFHVENNLDKKGYALKISISQGLGVELKEIQNLAKIPPHKHIVSYTTAWKDSLKRSEIEKLPLGLDMKTLLGKLATPSLDTIVIQMELCGIDLRKWMCINKTVYPIRSVNMFEQITLAMEHLHKHKLIHRDLKPENVFRSKEDPTIFKVGDMGISTDHSTGTKNQAHTRGFGTPLYIAPEQEYSGSYGPKVDLYPLGLILFELFHREIQPVDDNWDLLAQNFRDLKYLQKIPQDLTSKWPSISKLILQLTKPTPDDRPKYEDIYDMIKNFRSEIALKPKQVAQPNQKPNPVPQPNQKPNNPVAQPNQKPKPVAQPNQKPNPVAQPKQKPNPVAQPNQKPTPVAPPNPKPSSSAQPKSKPNSVPVVQQKESCDTCSTTTGEIGKCPTCKKLFCTKDCAYNAYNHACYKWIKDSEGDLQPYHTGVFCDTCPRKYFIIGPRYFCEDCENFDLCESCYTEYPDHVFNHEFLKFTEPSSYTRDAATGNFHQDLSKGQLVQDPKGICNNCDSVFFVGEFFAECQECDDFHLCEDCYNANVHEGHDFKNY